MKNACVVGYGNIGPLHANALDICKNAAFYAVCDTDKSKIDNCLKDYVVKAYKSYDDVINDKKIDSVHICTPHYLHTDMAIKALKAGKDVVLEKPAAISYSELDKLSEAVSSSTNKLCLMFQNRENKCVAMLKDIVSKRTDAPSGICGFLTWNRDADYYNSAGWRGTWEREGGALLINQAIHLIDMMFYMCGEVDSLRAHISNKSLAGIIEAEDTAEALLYFKNGARGCFYASNAFLGYSPYRLEVVFDDVTYRYADNCLYEIKNGEKPSVLAQDSIEAIGKLCWGSSHAIEIDKFYSDKDYVSLEDGRHSNKVVLAMYESSKQFDALIKL